MTGIKIKFLAGHSKKFFDNYNRWMENIQPVNFQESLTLLGFLNKSQMFRE